MSNPNQVYLNTSSAAGPYRSEIDMRQELLNTLFGTAQEIPKAQRGLLRRMRFDDDGVTIIKCPCVDVVTQEADRDYYCPVCLNERYLWDEFYLDYYFVQRSDDKGMVSKEVGLINVNSSVFYIPYNVTIKHEDKIAEIALDIEGNIIQPITRTHLWQITEVIPLRLDRGRVEFIKVFASIEDVRYLNAPDR